MSSGCRSQQEAGESDRLPETLGGQRSGYPGEGVGGEKWTGLFVFDYMLFAHILFELILVYPIII